MHLKHRLSAIAAISAFLTPQAVAYSLKDDYTADNFFDMFTFFTEDDPTHGYVDYVSQSAASSAGLINTNNNQIYMGVDTKNVATGRGRQSVRITSKAAYNHALILLDLEHMPASTCGTWPAFWTVGPNWPNNGEIDIIEGVNTQSANSMALHTGPGCAVGSTGGSSNTSPTTGGSSNAQAVFSGTVKTPNCDVAASGQATNAGCAITSSDASTYGSGLNAANGGVYATEWNSDVIRVWFFPRGSIPTDIDSGSPSPNSWGAPMAAFGSSSCDIDAAFRDQQIVFDTTFCGDWAGQVWSTDSTCSNKASTCQDYVQNNPEAFTDSFWTVNSLKVYTGADDNSSPIPSVSASRPASSSALTGIPPIGSPTATSISVPLPTGTGPSKPGFSNTGVNTPSAPFPSSAITSAPISIPNNPNPTTMYTSSRQQGDHTWGNGNGGGSNTNNNNNGWSRTRTRGWGSPPRIVKFAAAHLGFENPHTDDGPGATAHEARSASMPEVTGSPNPDLAARSVNVNVNVNVRTLVRPMVRRDDSEDLSLSESRRVRRQHLGRHKGGRHGGL